MSSYRRNKQRSGAMKAATMAVRFGRYSPAGLTALAAIILLSSLVSPHLWSGPRVALTDVAAPAVSFVGAPFRALGNTVSSVTGLTRIRAENARLNAENAQLKEWYQTAMLLRAENQSLRDLLNVIPEPDQSYISTRVIGDSGSGFVKSLLLEAGMQDGVKEGQAVLGGQGMIGRVTEVGGRAARVLLLSDINSHIPVIVEGANQRAILAGTNDDHLVLIHLPPDIMIKKGERIVTSGTGGLFPSGLPIGEVVDVKDGVPIVQMFSDPYATGYVQVVEKPQNQDVLNSIKKLTLEVK